MTTATSSKGLDVSRGAPWRGVERIEARIGERGTLLLFLVPALIVLVAAQFYPLAYSAWVSMVDWTLSRSPVPRGFVGFDNYAKAFSDAVFLGSIRTTIVFALATTALQMILGFLLAYLCVGEAAALRLSRTLLLMPMVIAPVAVGTIWRMMLSARVGPVNALLASLGIAGPDWLGDPDLALVALILIDTWEWTPFVMVIYVAALTSLPAEPLRAAAVDGASRWQIFRFVVFPMLLPVTILIAMFRLSRPSTGKGRDSAPSTRWACVATPSTVAPEVLSTTSASPSSRATTSVSRTVALSRCATAASSASPTPRPAMGTPASDSRRSRCRTAKPCPLRRVCESAWRIRSRNSALFGSPVSWS